MRLFIVMILVVVSGARAAEIRMFPLKTTRLKLTYKVGGETVRQAQGSARYAVAGGYYAVARLHGQRRRVNIDLTVVDGHEECPWRRRLRRPVIVISQRAVTIGRPARLPPHASALAVDDRPPVPKTKTMRQLVGLTKQAIVFVRLCGTARHCRVLMHQLGIRCFVFLDGGSSTDPWHRQPSHLVVE